MEIVSLKYAIYSKNEGIWSLSDRWQGDNAVFDGMTDSFALLVVRKTAEKIKLQIPSMNLNTVKYLYVDWYLCKKDWPSLIEFSAKHPSDIASYYLSQYYYDLKLFDRVFDEAKNYFLIRQGRKTKVLKNRVEFNKASSERIKRIVLESFKYLHYGKKLERVVNTYLRKFGASKKTMYHLFLCMREINENFIPFLPELEWLVRKQDQLQLLRGQKVILFGAGYIGKRALFLFSMCKYDILAVIDNDTSKHGMEYYGVPVISPKELHKYSFDKLVITTIKYHEVKNLLDKMGYAFIKDYLIFNEYGIGKNKFGSEKRTEGV